MCVDGLWRVCLVEDIGWFNPVGGDSESFIANLDSERFLTTGYNAIGADIRRV
jgi:hypothetical protein